MMTPLDSLVTVCKGDDMEQVQRCLSECVAQGVSINDANNTQRETPLMVACYWQRVYIAEYLLHCGADVNAHVRRGQTALHRAVDRSPVNVDVVKLLLAHGADVMARAGESRETPLHQAVSRTFDLELLETLVDAGADMTATTRRGWYDGFTPLHRACTACNVGAAEFLLSRGVDVNARGFNGWTPLKVADAQSYRYYIALWRLLLKHGADEHSADEKD